MAKKKLDPWGKLGFSIFLSGVIASLWMHDWRIAVTGLLVGLVAATFSRT